jgi:hypothetical protein
VLGPHRGKAGSGMPVGAHAEPQAKG